MSIFCECDFSDFAEVVNLMIYDGSSFLAPPPKILMFHILLLSKESFEISQYCKNLQASQFDLKLYIRLTRQQKTS